MGRHKASERVITVIFVSNKRKWNGLQPMHTLASFPVPITLNDSDRAILRRIKTELAARSVSVRGEIRPHVMTKGKRLIPIRNISANVKKSKLFVVGDGTEVAEPITDVPSDEDTIHDDGGCNISINEAAMATQNVPDISSSGLERPQPSSEVSNQSHEGSVSTSNLQKAPIYELYKMALVYLTSASVSLTTEGKDSLSAHWEKLYQKLSWSSREAQSKFIDASVSVIGLCTKRRLGTIEQHDFQMKVKQCTDALSQYLDPAEPLEVNFPLECDVYEELLDDYINDATDKYSIGSLSLNSSSSDPASSFSTLLDDIQPSNILQGVWS